MVLALLIVAAAVCLVATSSIGVNEQRPTLRASVRGVGILCGAAALALMIVAGAAYDWTGFGPSIVDGKPVPGKTLWDWLDLLIVPVVLGVGAWILDGSRRRSDADLEADRQRQKTLEDYLEAMTKMLMDQLLTDPESVEAHVARTRTLVALRSLDGSRKAQLLQFLYEADLISHPRPIVRLVGADFSGASLTQAVLKGAELRGVNFRRASFNDATLIDTDLRGSDFSEADLSGADCSQTDLRQAILATASVTPGALQFAKTEEALLPRM